MALGSTQGAASGVVTTPMIESELQRAFGSLNPDQGAIDRYFAGKNSHQFSQDTLMYLQQQGYTLPQEAITWSSQGDHASDSSPPGT